MSLFFGCYPPFWRSTSSKCLIPFCLDVIFIGELGFFLTQRRGSIIINSAKRLKIEPLRSRRFFLRWIANRRGSNQVSWETYESALFLRLNYTPRDIEVGLQRDEQAYQAPGTQGHLFRALIPPSDEVSGQKECLSLKNMRLWGEINQQEDHCTPQDQLKEGGELLRETLTSKPHSRRL